MPGTQIFIQILNMGWMASIVIFAVLLVRGIVMRNFPKKYVYWMWIIVGIRLICPISSSSPISLFNLRWLPDPLSYVSETDNSHASAEEGLTDIEVRHSGMTAGQEKQSGSVSGTLEHENGPQQNQSRKMSDTTQNMDSTPDNTADNLFPEEEVPERNLSGKILQTATAIWILGLSFLLLWNLFLSIRMKRRLRKAVLYHDNIFECDNIASPFVMGLLRPRIYIPFRLADQEREYILRHEQYHIHRKDHMIKLIAFLITLIYWFHPLVWLSYFCMVRDMEMSCDEYVLQSMDTDIRKDYSRLLLAFATNRRQFSMNLLSFGETDTKRRVKNIMNFKKKGKWTGVIAVLLLIIVGTVCLTNSPERQAENALGNDTASGTAIKNADTSTDEDRSNTTLISGHASEKQISAYREFLRDHASKNDFQYYSLAWMSDDHVVLLVSKNVNEIDNENRGSNLCRIYHLIEEKVVLCGEAACSSSGEWIHVSDGKILSDTHHSVTKTWVETGADTQKTETQTESDDKSTEYDKWQKEFDQALSVIFYTNPYVNKKARRGDPDLLNLQNDKEKYCKKILSGGSFFYEGDVTQDGKADTIIADIDKMENPSDADEKTITVTSGRTGQVIYSIPVHVMHGGWNNVYILKHKGGRISLMTWTPYMSLGIGAYEWKIFDLTENGEEKILEQDSFHFDLNHPKPEDPENLEKFVKKLNSYLKKATFFIGTDDNEVIYNTPKQTYDPDNELKAMKERS